MRGSGSGRRSFPDPSPLRDTRPLRWSTRRQRDCSASLINGAFWQDKLVENTHPWKSLARFSTRSDMKPTPTSPAVNNTNTTQRALCPGLVA